MRQPGDGEDRQLLAADQGGERVDRRDAGEDRLRGRLAVRRVERQPGHRRGRGGQHRRAAVDRLAAAVADPAQPGRADRDPQRASGERDPGVAGAEPVGALEHLDDGEVPVDLQHQPVPDLVDAVVVGGRTVANSSQPTPVTPRTTSSGPRSSSTPRWTTSRSSAAGRARRTHVSGLRASGASASRRARDLVHRVRRGLAGGPQDRGEVDLLDLGGGDPAVDQRLAGVDDREHGVDERGRLLGACSARRSASRALCCRTPSRSSRPASSTTRSRPGSDAGADELGEVGRAGPPRRASAITRARRRRPVRVAVAGVPDARGPRRRGRTSRTSRRPGSAARRPGRGPGTTARARTVRCAR